jgi:hypothetical protein
VEEVMSVAESVVLTDCLSDVEQVLGLPTEDDDDLKSCLESNATKGHPAPDLEALPDLLDDCTELQRLDCLVATLRK